MFTYRQLILAVTILSAKIIFADILVPGYKHEYSNSPAYLQSQSIPDYKVSPAVEQYAKQLAAQHLKQHLPEVQTVHPSYYQDKIQSNLVAYPLHSLHSLYHYPYHHISRPSGKLRYVKLGGHEYVRPSVFIGYPNTLAVHYRRKRSTDFTSVKSDKSAVATHDVATKPTLIDTKYPTAIDSLLPENESTNINDKHVKNRRREANFATKPFLFGLDPNKMYSEFKAKNLDNKEDETQHSLSKRHPATLITPVVLTQKLIPDSAKTTIEPAQRMSTYQEKRQNQEASSTNHENPHPTPNVPFTTKKLEQSSSPIITFQKQSSEEESHKDYSEYSKNYDSTYTYTLPMMSLRYPVPLTYRYWPNYITYNAEISPSNKKEYPHQQNASNHPIIQQASNQASSQEITTVSATNPAQPRRRDDVTNVYLCPDGPCPTGNKGTKTPPDGAAPSMPTTTPASMPTTTPASMPTTTPCVTCTRYRSNEEPSRSEIISAPNPGTQQVFYITPNDYTNYYSGEYIKDYQDNLGTDYQDYDYDENDYDEEPTYYTDGFHMYMKENSAYSSNVPSNKIYDNMFYSNINAQSNVAPMTYVAVVSSDVPQVQEPLLGAYYYPTKKTYVSYKPRDYNYYKYYYNYHNTIDSNYRNVPNVFYRAISSPVYY